MPERTERLISQAEIRALATADLATIQRMYAHYVRTTAYTFELEPPDVAELKRRADSLLDAGLPYLVASVDHVVVGFAYAGQYRPRAAYAHTLEDSVYLHPEFTGRGLGSALLSELLSICARGPWEQMIAVIGDSANTGSIQLHARHGFRHTGTLQGVGRKFGRAFDTVLMQRSLAPE